jgi:DNA polymerase-3 subunit delta
MIESIDNIIKTRNFPPVLLMFGEEEFLLDEAYQRLVEAAVDEETGSFNFDLLEGSESTPETVVEMASAFPMMAERRVVAVRHFDKLVSGRGGSRAEQKSPLATYFAAPSPTTLLILLASVPDLNGLTAAINNPKQKAKADKKLKSAKFPYNILLKENEWIEFPRLYDRDIPSWVARRFKQYKRDITPDACELLVAQVGTSLRDLHNEIEKILIYVGDKPKITRDDIVHLTGASKNYNIFELQKAIGLREFSRSIEIVQRMLSVDRQELLIITMLTRYFTILWKLSEARHMSRDNFELGKTVGVSPFFLSEYLGALQRYSTGQIERAFEALREADLSVKTSSGNSDIILQRMLTRILG